MKKLLLCAGVMLSSISFTQDSIIDMYKDQLDAIAAQLAEGDAQDLDATAAAAKMALQSVLTKFAEVIAKASAVVDVLAQSENKELVMANTQVFVRGLSAYLDSVQSAMNAGVMMGIAAQGLTAEYQAQIAEVNVAFEDIVLE